MTESQVVRVYSVQATEGPGGGLYRPYGHRIALVAPARLRLAAVSYCDEANRQARESGQAQRYYIS